MGAFGSQKEFFSLKYFSRISENIIYNKHFNVAGVEAVGSERRLDSKILLEGFSLDNQEHNHPPYIPP